MAFKVADLFADLSLRTSEFTKGVKNAVSEARTIGTAFSDAVGKAPQQEIKKTEKHLKGAFSSMRGAIKDTGRVVTGILISQMFYTILRNVKEATAAAIEFKSEMEQAAISFSLMLNSREVAGEFITELKRFAATTPFTMASAKQAAQQLLAMGWQVESVIPTLRTFLDAASIRGASPDTINRITLAFGQMKAAGRVLGGEIRQLYEIGIPALKILQEELGLTQEQLGRIGQLQIPADVAIAALLRGLEKRYKGASQLLAKTLPGLISTLADNLLNISEVLVSGPYDKFKNYIKGLTDITTELDLLASERGAGAVFEKLFPKQFQTTLRTIIASFGELARSVGLLFAALKPVASATTEWILRGLANSLPYINAFVRAIAMLAYIVSKSTILTRLLGLAIAALAISATVSVSVAILTTAISKLGIAAAVAKAVTLLKNAILLLNAAFVANPVTGLIMLTVAALLALALSSKTVVQWLDSVMSRISALLGLNIGNVLMPTDPSNIADAMGEFNKSLVDSMGNLKGTGKEAEKAGKKIKEGFLASFDEVYDIPDKAGDIGLGLDDLSDLVNMPDTSVFDKLFEELDTSNISLSLSQEVDGLLKKLRKAFEDMEPLKLPPVIWPEFPQPPAPPPLPVENIIQTLAFLTGAYVLFKKSLKQWAIDTGQLVLDWSTQKVINLRNAGITAGQAIKGFVDTTKQDIKQWASSTYENISNWGRELSIGIELACTAAIVAILKFISNTKTSFNTWVTDTITNFAFWKEQLKTIFSESIQNIKDTISNGLESTALFWENHKQTILLIVATLIAGIVLFFIGLPASIMTALATLVLLVVTAFVDTKVAVAAEMKETKDDVIGKWEQVKDRLTGVFTKIKDTALNAFENMKTGIKGAINYIIDMINELLNKWNAIKFEVPSVTIPFVGTFGGYSVGVPQIPNLPRLATGGVVYKNTLAELAEGNRPEAVIPLSSEGLRPFAQALMQELSLTKQGSDSQKERLPVLFVHTLIADERGLKELDRRLEVVRLSEQQRRGDNNGN